MQLHSYSRFSFTLVTCSCSTSHASNSTIFCILNSLEDYCNTNVLSFQLLLKQKLSVQLVLADRIAGTTAGLDVNHKSVQISTMTLTVKKKEYYSPTETIT